MLRNTPKCVRKVLIIRFNELGVNVSHRAVFIPQKFGSRARIFYFTFFPLWQKRKKENGEKKGREKTKKKLQNDHVVRFAVRFLIYRYP